MAPLPPDLPAHDQLADILDEDNWDREKHGKFSDFATDGDEVPIDRYDFREVTDDADDDAPAE